MRSVQSANSVSDFSVPMPPTVFTMLVTACPEAIRRARASYDVMCAKSLGMTRVPGVPIA